MIEQESPVSVPIGFPVRRGFGVSSQYPQTAPPLIERPYSGCRAAQNAESIYSAYTVPVPGSGAVGGRTAAVLIGAPSYGSVRLY